MGAKARIYEKRLGNTEALSQGVILGCVTYFSVPFVRRLETRLPWSE
jgi:hypothetical protein